MKKIKNMLILFLMFGISYYAFSGLASSLGMYAALNQVEPTSTLILGSNNNTFDWMFGSDGIGGTSLAPGESATGVLRIVNETGNRQRISQFGANIQLAKGESRVNYDSDARFVTPEYQVGNDFMQWMVIEIDYLNPMDGFFTGDIFEGSLQAFTQGVDWSYTLSQGRYVDLVYTISFSEDADKTVAGIKGLSEFLVTIDTLDNESNQANIGNNNNNGDEEEFLIIDDEETPLGAIDIFGHYAQEEISALIELGILTGYPDGSIRPEWNTTRAEVAVMLAKAMALNITDDQVSPYSDDLPMWAKMYILSATQAEVFEGYPDGTFAPNQYITRQEVAKVFALSSNITYDPSNKMQFIDLDGSEWGYNYIKALYDNNVVEGYPNGTFQPDAAITRGEFFMMLYNMLLEGHLEGGMKLVAPE